ncbi:hypothetical protein ABPG72_016187 [Tetrahymena utriculariae]
MEQFKQKLKELGNPYHLLELDDKKHHSKKEIKSAYKAMALKYHPDKNSSDDAQERFHKIQLAYKLLSDPEQIKQYEELKQTSFDQQKRVDEMNTTQRKFYDDLLKREQEFKEQEEQKKKQQMKDLLKRHEKQKEREQERQEEEKQRQQQKEEKIRQELSNQEFHSKINSIRVKWSKKDKVQYNQKILNMQFRQYGPIKHITILDSKRRAVIEFLTATAAENAVKENSTQNNSDSSDNENEDLKIQTLLKVKFLLKEKERKEMINLIEVKTKEANKPKDMSLNTNNLNKIADILSRGSISKDQRKNIISSNVSELKRQQEKKKYIEESLQKDE